MATAGPQDPQTKRRNSKGHGWSNKEGSKASRRRDRELERKPRFYAVAVGWRPGVYRHWCDAAAQVNGYENNVHKSFPTLREAREFMRFHRHIPPSVHTPFPPAPDTPPPSDKDVYPNHTDDDSTETTNPDPATFVPTIQVGPPMDPAKFAPVAEIAERIAKDTENLILDVSECPCQTCPYSRVGLMEQRFLLMRRLFQLNSQLSFPHVNNY